MTSRTQIIYLTFYLFIYNLFLLFYAEEPKVLTKPISQRMKEGSTVFINLQVEGFPPPQFQWYKNGYTMDGVTGQSLIMDNVNQTHSGTYSCEVQNIAGGLIWLEATIVVFP